MLNNLLKNFASTVINLTSFVKSTLSVLQKNLSSDNELQTRVYSGTIFGIIFLIVIYFGGLLFNIGMIMIMLVMIHEWLDITNATDFSLNQTFIIGLCYCIIPIASLITIRGYYNGAGLIFWYFLIIWSTDCGAYFIGKRFGGKKLLPSVSPGKTISGAIGGCICAFLAGIIFYISIRHSDIGRFGAFGCGILAVMISVLAQIGDLTESYIKRKYGVKDSGNIIPGHGGMMDRLDSITFSSLFFLFAINRII